MIEKTLKAWVTVLHLSYPKSHDISRLVQILENAGADVSRFPDLDAYSVFAVQYRYEAYDEGGERLDRDAVVNGTREFMSHVRHVIERAPS